MLQQCCHLVLSPEREDLETSILSKKNFTVPQTKIKHYISNDENTTFPMMKNTTGRHDSQWNSRKRNEWEFHLEMELSGNSANNS